MYYRLKKRYVVQDFILSTPWLDLIFKMNSLIPLVVIDSSICILSRDADKINSSYTLHKKPSVSSSYIVVWTGGGDHIDLIANKVNNNFLNNFK